MTNSFDYAKTNPFMTDDQYEEPTLSDYSSNVISNFSDMMPTTFFDHDYETLVSDIESGHATCASIIRKIREPYVKMKSTPSYSSNSTDDGNILPPLLQHLRHKAENRKTAIELMCRQKYQGFVDSIRELVRVKDEVSLLKSQLASTATNVEQSTSEVLSTVEKYERCQETLRNISDAMEALKICLPILDQYSKVKRNIEDNRFFPALKSLGSLEHSQLPLISTYDFSKSLTAQIPAIREQIKEKSNSQHTDFLESVRRHSVRLGALAMSHTANKIGMKVGSILSDSHQESEIKRRSYLENPFTGEIQNTDALEKEWNDLFAANCTKRPTSSANLADYDCLDEYNSNIEDLVDFGPVYRCLHIYSALGERATFEKAYRLDRRKQWLLCVNKTQTQQIALKNYSEFFSSIVGFYVVEDYIMHTVQSMVSKSYLDELWTETIQNLNRILNCNVQAVTKTEVLLRLKDICILFTRTMLFLGFNITGFKEIFEIIRNRYHSLLAEEWKKRFEEIFDGDDYSAIYLRDVNEYHHVLDMYPCQSPEFDILPFPKSLHFSLMVPRIFLAIKEYINICSQFSENLDLSQTEREDMVYKATNTLFSDSLKLYMSSSVRRIHDNLLQLIQLSLNMDELENSCLKLEEYIQTIIYGNPNSTIQLTTPHSHRSRLHGQFFFETTRAEAESQIFFAINLKVDEFFTLARYDWTQEETHAGARMEASSYIEDLMDYLKGTFRAFTHLPPKVAELACISACKYIAETMQNFLVKNDVKFLSETALQQLSLDLAVCEKFATCQPIVGVDSSSFSLTFQDLRQLLDLVLRDNWAVFFKTYGKDNSPYFRVSPGNVIKVLEKVREWHKKHSSLFRVMTKAEKEKRNRIDDALHKLRDLQQSMHKH